MTQRLRTTWLCSHLPRTPEGGSATFYVVMTLCGLVLSFPGLPSLILHSESFSDVPRQCHSCVCQVAWSLYHFWAWAFHLCLWDDSPEPSGLSLDTTSPEMPSWDSLILPQENWLSLRMCSLTTIYFSCLFPLQRLAGPHNDMCSTGNNA